MLATTFIKVRFSSRHIVFLCNFMVAIFLVVLVNPALADSHLKNEIEKVETPFFIQKQKEQRLRKQTLATIMDFVELQERLQQDLNNFQNELKVAKSETEIADLKGQIKDIQARLKDTKSNIENIAADTDLGLLKIEEQVPFDLQKELLSLLEPALIEMKHATNGVRKKSDLREKIAFYSIREPIIEEALANVSDLNKANKDPKVAAVLKKMNEDWSNQLVYIQSELKAKQLQLTKIEAEETDFLDQSESFFKTFFERRGWVLTQAFLAIVGILIISRLILKLLTKYLKGYKAQYRSVQLRVVDLVHRIGTILFIIIGPMVVFYLEEDWVLFSLGVLFLIAFSWKLGQAIPRYWAQLELFLNVGPVREGERLIMHGIPWRVKNINMYSLLENPVADLSLRLDINDLVDLRSHKFDAGAPWFPCKKGDWVILKDGLRGKVIGISLELVQLVQRGGAITTYQMSTFLSLSPLNMSKSYRLKETFGISYKHQNESTTEIVQKLKFIINQRALDEGYEEVIQSINVEFESAADSSLNLVVIADFKGQSADISNRLRRSIQRWCVEAATDNDWEIPFPQMQLHAEQVFEA